MPISAFNARDPGGATKDPSPAQVTVAHSSEFVSRLAEFETSVESLAAAESSLVRNSSEPETSSYENKVALNVVLALSKARLKVVTQADEIGTLDT
jgi:hypothetical protein